MVLEIIYIYMHNNILMGFGCINVSVCASINQLSYVCTLNYNYNTYIWQLVNLINLYHTVRACLIWLTDDDYFHEIWNHVVTLLLNLMKWVLPLKSHMGNTWCKIDIQCMTYCVYKWRLHCLFQCTHIIWDVYYPLCYFLPSRSSGVN